MEIETGNGLRLEVAGRELTGPLRAEELNGRRRGLPRRSWGNYLLGLLAVLVIGVLLALLVVPMGWTVGRAFRADLADLFTDPGALRSAWHSVLWVGIALVLILVGYVIAVLSRQVGRLWRVLLYVLILPFGVSAVVSGAVFRLIFDPNPERGMASALFGGSVTWLGPDLIWWVLASAFAWSWLGFVVVLFRAGLDTTGGPGMRFGRLTLPRPGPVTSIVVLTVLVAAIRVFDLVLIAAPGSIRDDVDVVGLHWWRMTSRGDEPGGAALLAVLLFVVVALVGAVGMRTMRRPEQTEFLPPPAAPIDVAPRWWGWPLVVLVGLMWLLPVVVLVATAFHTPVAAGSLGWWHLTGIGLGSFAEAGATWLWPAVAGSLMIAGLATGLVLAAAVPAAYLLTWVLPLRVSRVLTVALTILAVAPVQMYAGPLGDAFAGLGLVGSRAPLALVHAAAGLPFATLVLRTAFLSAPRRTEDGRPSLDKMWRRGPYRTTLIAVLVLEFVLVWNDFIVGFLVSGPGTSPLTLLLWGEARQFGTSAGTVAASAVVSALIPVALLLATWRKVVVGLTGGIVR
jgi:alpha-glucoside transport system permease protein